VNTTLSYNWDNKLRTGQVDANNFINLRYDPAGNRIHKSSTVAGQTTDRKYIVDIAGDLPVILMELELDANSLYQVEKAYIYANSQPLTQIAGDDPATDPRYFYLHDRLGSVRQVIATDGTVENFYTYEPFGNIFPSENTETVENPFKFTGQYYDSETSQYYLRARQYEPNIQRFLGRDPYSGKFEQPMTLHKYLYCGNDSVNRWDPRGLYYELPWVGGHYDITNTQTIVNIATGIVGSHFIWGPTIAFGFEEFWGSDGWLAAALGRGSGAKGNGMFDYKYSGLTFSLFGYNTDVTGSEFSNYLAGYTTYYNYRFPGLLGAVLAGDIYAFAEYGRRDELDSILWLTRGAMDANDKLKEETGRGIQGQLDAIFMMNTKRQVGMLGFIEEFESVNTDWLY
jgi:RHS repeat-associated protein